jgi:hypothetical protein
MSLTLVRSVLIGTRAQMSDLKKITLAVLALVLLAYLLLRFISPAGQLATCEFQGGVCQSVPVIQTGVYTCPVQPGASFKNLGPDLCKKQNADRKIQDTAPPLNIYICCKKQDLDSLLG